MVTVLTVSELWVLVVAGEAGLVFVCMVFLEGICFRLEVCNLNWADLSCMQSTI